MAPPAAGLLPARWSLRSSRSRRARPCAAGRSSCGAAGSAEQHGREPPGGQVVSAPGQQVVGVIAQHGHVQRPADLPSGRLVHPGPVPQVPGQQLGGRLAKGPDLRPPTRYPAWAGRDGLRPGRQGRGQPWERSRLRKVHGARGIPLWVFGALAKTLGKTLARFARGGQDSGAVGWTAGQDYGAVWQGQGTRPRCGGGGVLRPGRPAASTASCRSR